MTKVSGIVDLPSPATTKTKPKVVMVKGQEETHPEGFYYFQVDGGWERVSESAGETQQEQKKRLARQPRHLLHDCDLVERPPNLLITTRHRGAQLVQPNGLRQVAVVFVGLGKAEDCPFVLRSPAAGQEDSTILELRNLQHPA
jgi:hypothetical protein